MTSASFNFPCGEGLSCCRHETPHSGTMLTKREEKKKRKSGRDKRKEGGKGKEAEERNKMGKGKKEGKPLWASVWGRGVISREICGPCGLNLIQGS